MTTPAQTVAFDGVANALPKRDAMKLYVVMHQCRPRGVFRIALATESLAKAKARKAQVRRGYIMTWRDGRVVACEEPPARRAMGPWISFLGE